MLLMEVRRASPGDHQPTGLLMGTVVPEVHGRCSAHGFPSGNGAGRIDQPLFSLEHDRARVSPPPFLAFGVLEGLPLLSMMTI
jgi:hypothetical protein